MVVPCAHWDTIMLSSLTSSGHNLLQWAENQLHDLNVCHTAKFIC